VIIPVKTFIFKSKATSIKINPSNPCYLCARCSDFNASALVYSIAIRFVGQGFRKFAAKL
jgi:hypothetical protein